MAAKDPFIFAVDTVKSHRPYQDVIAINDFSDLAMFDTRRRRVRNSNGSWGDDPDEDKDGRKKSLLERIVSNLIKL